MSGKQVANTRQSLSCLADLCLPVRHPAPIAQPLVQSCPEAALAQSQQRHVMRLVSSAPGGVRPAIAQAKVDLQPGSVQPAWGLEVQWPSVAATQFDLQLQCT